MELPSFSLFLFFILVSVIINKGSKPDLVARREALSVHLKPAFSPDTEKGYVIEDVFPSLTRRNSSKIEISLLKQARREKT